MRLVVTGAGGMLGQDMQRVANDGGHEVIALDRAALDITDEAAVHEAIAEAEPDAVVNCAAWTDVDGAESDSDGAYLLNATAARHVAAAAGAAGASVVYPSTDYVFDGLATQPYVEADRVRPASIYGASKLAGEQETAHANPRHYTVRTSWLFGTGGKNFVETMLAVGGRDGRVKVVTDQVGSPTYTRHLAEGILHLVGGNAYGVHHMAGTGSCSWFDFAREIFARAGVDAEVEPTTSAEFVRPAPRPAYSVLGTQRQDAVALPAWQRGLADYLEARA